MTLQQFKDKYLGKQVEYHSYNPNAKFQCVDLANQYIVEVLKLDPVIGTDAKDIPTKINKKQFDVFPNTPDFKPKQGDIAIWNGKAGGGAGHIAIVIDDKATLSKFNSLDQNYSKPLFVTLETHTYANVSHFIRAKVQSTPEPMPEKTYAEAEMTAVRLERDKNWNLYQSQLAETEQYKSESSARKKEYDDLLSELAQKLTLPSTSDKPSIMGAIDRTLEVEEQLRVVSKKYDAEVQARKADYLKYQEQLQSFSSRIDQMEENHQKEIDRLRSDLEKALKDAEVANEALITVTRFSSFWKGITRLIKG